MSAERLHGPPVAPSVGAQELKARAETSSRAYYISRKRISQKFEADTLTEGRDAGLMYRTEKVIFPSKMYMTTQLSVTVLIENCLDM